MKKKDEFMNQRTGLIKGLLLLVCIASVPLFADNFINQPTDAIIRSTANARGVQNVDTSLTDQDAVEVTLSKVCSLEISGACDATPIEGPGTPVPPTVITGPVTLDTSGHYCLAADLELSSGDAIVITGTNVTLDLNGYTISGLGNKGGGISISGDCAEVFNGTIMRVVGAGISITGNKNNIHDVTVKDSPIGIELVRADNNTIERCRALSNTEAGFSLTLSNYNQFIDDQALATSGTGDVYGFVSGGGQGNRFIGSLAEGTETTSYATNTVAGFALVVEQCSEICGSTANKTIAADGYADAYGIFVQTFTGAKAFDFDTNVGFFADGEGTEYLDAKWLVCNGNKYLAIGGPENGSGVTVRVMKYDTVAETLTSVATFNHGATIRSIDWIDINGRTFLAIGGDASYDYYSFNVRILEFDCVGETLTEVAAFDTTSTYIPGPSSVYSLEWLQGTNYLAVGGPVGANDTPLQLFEFNLTYETLSLFTLPSDLVPFDSVVNELNWLSCEGTHYMVVVGTVASGTLNFINVYEFDGYTPSLPLVVSEFSASFPALNKEPRTAKWLLCGDTKYIAVGTAADMYGSSDIWLFTFDQLYPASLTLNTGSTYTHNATINDVEWLEKDGCKFLGVTAEQNGNEFFMLELNPTTELFTEISGVSIDIYSFGAGDGSLNRFDWLDCGDAVLAGFTIEPPIPFFPSALVSALSITQLQATNNVIKNNVVNGTTGGVGGIGLFMNIDNNLMIGNVSCNNDTNYEVTGLIIQPSAVIKSQMDARGVQNVDCSLTDADSVEVIESKVCAIDSKLDTLQGACDATPIDGAGTPVPSTAITGPVTLNASGHYCLAADLDVASGDAIVITGTNVTLDLNGYTISNSGSATNGIVISGDNAEIFNGTISGFANAGISITGNKNNIHDVTAKDNAIGFELVGADNNVIEHSSAQCNTQAGFSLTNSNYNQFIDDTALATSGSGDVYGFVSTSGQGNRFINSVAENTSTTSTVIANTVAGFALLGSEQCTEICGSTASKTTPATGFAEAFGILIQEDQPKTFTLLNPLSAVFVDGNEPTEFLDAKWLICDGAKYLAVAGEENSTGVTVRILAYDTTTKTLTQVPGATFNHGATVRSIDWVECNGKQYLALGGDNAITYYPNYPDYYAYPDYPDFTSVNVRVLEFDCTYGTLSERASFDTGSTTPAGSSVINSLEWLQGTKYLAVTGPAAGTNSAIQILEFDETYETLSLFTALAPAIGGGILESVTNELNWLTCDGVDYLVAVGTATLITLDVLNVIGVYEFDRYYPSLTQIVADTSFSNLALNKEMRTAKWLLCGDQKYVAVGTAADGYGISDILLFEFTPYPAAITLKPYATFNHDATINDVEWLEKLGCKFLGVTSAVNGNEFFMLEFDPSYETFTLIPEVTIDTAATLVSFPFNRFDWLDCGDVILAGFSIEPPFPFFPSASVSSLRIKEATTGSATNNNIVKNNVVNGTTGGFGGIGYSLNIDNNLMMSNVSCDNDTNYSITGSTFNSSEIIKSQADARGVQNVDCALTNADTVEVIESKVCALLDGTVCNPTAITASETPVPSTAITGPVTLNASGHYCLAADLSVATGDAIVITGTNVTLDLNGYTISNTGSATNGIVISGDGAEIYNGTISGFADAGISITGNKNNIHDVTAQGNTIGFELVGADSNTIENSSALCNTSAGFSLSTSTNNCISNSAAIKTQGIGDTYGFISTGGRSNRFVNTVAKDTQITQPDLYNTLTAAGFCLGSGELCSEISNSTVNKVSAEGAPDFDCATAMIVTSTKTTKPPANVSTSWLECDNKRYIASGGAPDGSGNDVRIYRFDEGAQTLTLVASFDQGTSSFVLATDWLVSDGRIFLAVGAEDMDQYGADVRVLEFDCTSETLFEVASIDLIDFATYITADFAILSLEWQICNNEKYLAVAVDSLYPYPGYLELKPVQILKFDSTIGFESLTQVADFGLVDPNNPTAYLNVQSVRWLDCGNQIFIAARGQNTIQILDYDCQYESLSLTTSGIIDYDYGPIVPVGNDFFTDTRWLVCENRKFLAYSNFNNPNSTVNIAEFDAGTGELTALPISEPAIDIVSGFAWGQLGSCKYLAVTKDDGQLLLYSFDATNETLTLVDSVTSPGAGSGGSPNFQMIGTRLFLANTQDVGDLYVQEIEAYGSTMPTSIFGIKVAADAFDNVISSNLVHGIRDLGTTANGIGFSLNFDNNFFVSNKSCDNDTNYGLTGTSFAQSDIIKSQADARGVQNVDCALIDPDSVEVIESKVCVIEDTINQDFGGTFTVLDVIESKVCGIDMNITIIDSKLDTFAPCDPTPITASETPIPATPITGPVTLDTSGHYCLAADLDVASGDAIVITGTNVTLDLNGYTISGGGSADSGIVISGACAEICNGTASGFTSIAGAISVQGSNAFIHDVTVKDSSIGIGVPSTGTGLVLESCHAVNNSLIGFAFNASTDGAFLKCRANGNGNGFLFLDTERCSIIDCVAYSNLFNGFSIQNVTECSFVRCIANSNNNNGFRFTGYDSTFSEMKDCQAMYNAIHGFDMSSAASTVSFYRNIACHNPPS